MGKGLQNVLKNSGEMKVSENGESVVWVWDYVKDEPRKKSEMTKSELQENKKARETWRTGNNKNHKCAK